LGREKLCGRGLALPLQDIIFVAEDKAKERFCEINVSLLPVGVRLLFQLQDLKAIEVDGIEGLILPLVLKAGESTPGEDAEPISKGLHVQ